MIRQQRSNKYFWVRWREQTDIQRTEFIAGNCHVIEDGIVGVPCLSLTDDLRIYGELRSPELRTYFLHAYWEVVELKPL